MCEIYTVNRKMWNDSINIHDERLLSNGFVIAKNFTSHMRNTGKNMTVFALNVVNVV